MRSFAIALVLAALLVVELAWMGSRLPVLAAAPLLVAFGVVGPLIVQRGFSWLGVACGGLSSLLLGALFVSSPHLALFGCCLLWLAPRAWLARSARDLAFASAAALAASVVAAWVVNRYLGETPLLHIASCVFAGAALAMAAMVGKTDVPLVHALRVAAQASTENVRGVLEEAARLAQRQVDASAISNRSRTSLAPARRLARLADQWLALRGFDDQESNAQREKLVERMNRALSQLGPPAPPAPKPVEARPESERTGPGSGRIASAHGARRYRLPRSGRVSTPRTPKSRSSARSCPSTRSGRCCSRSTPSRCWWSWPWREARSSRPGQSRSE